MISTHACSVCVCVCVCVCVREKEKEKHPFDVMEDAHVCYHYLCILFAYMSLCPVVLSYWQEHISTLFVYSYDFQIILFQMSIYKQIIIIIFYHPYNVLLEHFMIEGALRD